MGGAVAPAVPQAVDQTAIRIEGQSFGGESRPCGIAEKALQPGPIPCGDSDGRMHADAADAHATRGPGIQEVLNIDSISAVRRFQEDGDPRIFLISLRAGGLGLNLTAAEYVYLLDPWWNPAVESQAIDRAHCIGQTRPVIAYRLVAAGTIEEKILELQASKRELADAILSEGASVLRDLTREDLELLLS
jgi:hypothetical protein